MSTRVPSLTLCATQPFLLSKTLPLLAALAVLAMPAAHAASGTWNSTSSAAWSGSTNWLGNVIADGVGATGDFSQVDISGATKVVTIDTATRTLGILTIGDSAGETSGYTIASSGTLALIFDNGASAAQITQISTSANNIISAATTLNSAVAITNSSTNNFSLAGNLTGSKNLTYSGGANGALVLYGSDNTAFTGNVIVQSGNFSFTSSDVALNSSNTVSVNSGASFSLGVAGAGNAPNATIAGLNDGVGGGGIVSRVGTSPGGSRTVTLGGSGAYSFSGTITNGIGVVNLAKNGLGTQTLSRSNDYTGSTAVNGGGNMILSGSSGALSATSGITVTNGSIALDSAASNNTNRVNDSANVSIFSGNLSLRGNASTSTTETIGALTFYNGQSTITVDRNGNTSGADLTFASLARSASGQINFVGIGGTLGTAGGNPRIKFTANPATSNSVIGNNTNKGYATINGTDFAGYDATQGVVAVTSTAVSGALTTASTQNSRLTASATIAGSDVSYNTLKIDAGAAATLTLNGSGNISAGGILLSGTNDFTIQNGGGGTGGFGFSGIRNFYVNDAATTLNIGVTFTGAAQDIAKGGAGFMALTGTANQVAFTSVKNITINEGTLRGTTTNLGGGTSAGGAFTTINLRGGVLELDGGGTFSRAIDQVGTVSGGGISWDQNGTTNLGSGGFSAINGNATVTLVTTIGGSTAANLVWNDGAFVSSGQSLIMGSTKANSRIDLTNNIALDNGTAALLVREVRVLDNGSSSTDIARFSGTISGARGTDLAKTGAGTLELTKANTYAGQTFVTAGTLLVNNTAGSGLGTGNVTVDGTGKLGGGGSFTGKVTVNSGGTLAPGSSIESLGSGDLAFNNGSTFGYEVDSLVATSVGADLQIVTGSLSLSDTVTLTLSNLNVGTFANGTTFSLINYTGAWNLGTLTYNASNLADDSTFSFNGQSWLINYDATTGGSNFVADQVTGNFVNITVVPEPSTVVLMGLGAALFLFRPRRSTRQA